MAITFEKTPLEWKNSGTEPSTDLKENGFSAGYRPAAATFNYQINNTSECLTELQTKLSDLDGDVIKGVKGNGTTINPSSTGVINITPNNIGAAASTHYHNASQITSGVLPIERGGTGATTLEEVKKTFGGGTVLYSNESGTNVTITLETITLSDDISNYKFVEVYFRGFTKLNYSFLSITSSKTMVIGANPVTMLLASRSLASENSGMNGGRPGEIRHEITIAGNALIPTGRVFTRTLNGNYTVYTQCYQDDQYLNYYECAPLEIYAVIGYKQF